MSNNVLFEVKPKRKGTSRKGKRTYDANTINQGIELSIQIGVCEAAKQLGIPPGTLCNWRNRAGFKSRDRRAALVGHKFHRLTVVRFEKRVKTKFSSRVFWFCKCECGGTTVAHTWHLKSGHVKSCGCLFKFEKGEAAFNHLYHVYEKGACQRNYKFELTKEEFRALTKTSCFYCGDPPTTTFKTHPSANGVYFYNGVDRVDNNIGYTRENAVACCKTCNLAKRDLSVRDFIVWVERLAGNLPTLRHKLEGHRDDGKGAEDDQKG